MVVTAQVPLASRSCQVGPMDVLHRLLYEHDGTFLFRPPILVEEVQRVVCVPESVALRTFLDFLEMIGPNIILVVKF